MNQLGFTVTMPFLFFLYAHTAAASLISKLKFFLSMPWFIIFLNFFSFLFSPTPLYPLPLLFNNLRLGENQRNFNLRQTLVSFPT